MNRRSALPLLAVLALAACGEATESTSSFAWDGAEPERPGKSDAPGSARLSIFSKNDQTSMTVIPPLGALGLSPEATGRFHLEGYAIDEDVVIVIDGDFHRHDGHVERHTLLVSPHYTSQEEGAPNPEGYLTVDLKDKARVRVVRQDGDELGTRAGAFRGRIYATKQLSLGSPLPADLDELVEEPPRGGRRPANAIDFTSSPLHVRPHLAITRVLPSRTDCLGAELIDATTSGTKLEVATAVYGFAPGDEVEVELEYHVPEQGARGFWSHSWGSIARLWRPEAWVETKTRTMRMGREAHDSAISVRFDGPDGEYETAADDFWDDDAQYTLNIHARARVLNAPAPIASTSAAQHTMVVTNGGELVVADYFEMCRPEDEQCRAERERTLPANLVARRQHEEWEAIDQGRFETKRRPLTDCTGGGAFAGPYSETCSVYQADSDRSLKASIEAELQGNVEFSGQVSGRAAAAGIIPGLGEADIRGKLEAAFNLSADFDASFRESRTWSEKQDINVLFDSAETHIQWWRIIHPRVRYMRIVEYDQCGAEVRAQEAFVEDYTDSSMVLTCRSKDTNPAENACNPIYPDAAGIEACESALIDPQSERGEQCLGEPGIYTTGPILEIPTSRTPTRSFEPEGPQSRRVQPIERCDARTLRQREWRQVDGAAQELTIERGGFRVPVLASDRDDFIVCHDSFSPQDAAIELKLYSRVSEAQNGPSQETILRADPGRELVERMRAGAATFNLGIHTANFTP